MSQATLDPVPFRIERMGDPPLPIFVHDGGDRSRPYDANAMRSQLVPHDLRGPYIDVVLLWDRYVAARTENKALHEALEARNADAAAALAEVERFRAEV